MNISNRIISKNYDYYRTGDASDSKTDTKGGYALIGGSSGPGKDQAIQWMIDRSGGGDFVVLRGTGDGDYNDYIEQLGAVDSVETIVVKSKDASEDPFVLDQLKKAEAVFLSGGDQWNYLEKWKGTSLQSVLNEKAANGVPIGGTSAGLAVMGEHVFSAEKASVTSEETLADPFNPGVTLENDFLKIEPLKNTITDTHFSERDRMGRLLSFMARLEKPVRGIGVDESTSFLLDPDGTGELIGSGSAYFVEASAHPEQCEPGKSLEFREVPGYRLDAGGTFDLNSWEGDGGEPFTLSAEDGELTWSQNIRE